jgi:hypothetical protein
MNHPYLIAENILPHSEFGLRFAWLLAWCGVAFLIMVKEPAVKRGGPGIILTLKSGTLLT